MPLSYRPPSGYPAWAVVEAIDMPMINHFVEQAIDNSEKRFKGKLLSEMSRQELMTALSYMIQIVPALCERHKEELIELIGIKEAK
jgi:hypothetical protein